MHIRISSNGKDFKRKQSSDKFVKSISVHRASKRLHSASSPFETNSYIVSGWNLIEKNTHKVCIVVTCARLHKHIVRVGSVLCGNRRWSVSIPRRKNRQTHTHRVEMNANENKNKRQERAPSIENWNVCNCCECIVACVFVCGDASIHLIW